MHGNFAEESGFFGEMQTPRYSALVSHTACAYDLSRLSLSLKPPNEY